MMAARVAASGTRIDTDTPSALFALPAASGEEGSAWYATSRDGLRFLIASSVDGAPPITVLLNWKPKH